MVVYLITNITNGKQYVGQTIKPISIRFSNHCSKGNALFKAIQKYGAENFTISTLSICSNINELNDAEAYWIDHYQTIAPSGYNLTSGGEGYTRSEANRLALSLSHLGKMRGKDHPMYGKKHKASSLEKMTAASKGNSNARGYRHSEAAKAAMSEKKKGRTPWNKGLKGAQKAWNKGLRKSV